jgi:hypothetical protein
MYPKPQKLEKRRSKTTKLKLSEPKEVTFWIAVALAVLGVLVFQGIISGLAGYAFWLVVAGFCPIGGCKPGEGLVEIGLVGGGLSLDKS